MFLTKAFLTLFLLIAPTLGYCQYLKPSPEMLSGFLRENTKSRLIVMEGDRHLDADDKKALDRILRDRTTTVPEKLQAIAERCDYTAQVYDGSAYLLTKRYSDLREMPCVSPEEIIAFAQEASNAVAALLPESPETTSSPPVHYVLRALSAGARERVHRDMLPVRDLDPEARKRIAWMITNTFYGSLRWGSKNVGLVCRGLDDARLEIRHNPDGGPYLSLQTYSKGKQGIEWGIQRTVNMHALPNKRAADQALSVNASFSGTLLQDVLKELNARSRDGTVYSAAPSLVRKPVSVIGLESASSPRRVLRAVARLYELQVVTTTKGDVQLTRKRVPGPQTGVSMGRQIITAMPAPVRRTLKHGNYQTAAHLLLLSLLPRVEKAKLRSLQVRSLDGVYKVAIVLSVFQQMAGELRDNDMAKLPRYLSLMDTMYLQARQESGGLSPLRFNILWERNGKLVPAIKYTVFRQPDERRP